MTEYQQKADGLVEAESALVFYGRELRLHRERAGLTQSQLGNQVNYSDALVGKIEKGERSPSREFTERCDAVLQTGGALGRLLPLIHRGHFPPWFRGYVQLEQTATDISTFEGQVVPGLFQTEDYARAILAAGPPRDHEEVDNLVGARMARKEMLTRRSPRPPLLWVLLDENVLRRPVGGAAVMRGQLTHLLSVAAMPRVILQAVPLAAGAHAGLLGPITLLSFAEGPNVAYLDGPVSGVIVDRSDEVAACKVMIDLLRAVALSPDASAALIRSVLEST